MEADQGWEGGLPEALRGLHDAVLTKIDIAWSIRVCEFHFRGAPLMGAGQPFLIRFDGIRSVVVPTGHPWGASSSVLEVRFVAPDTYVFEMQSGDEISVHSTAEPARSFGSA